MRKFRKRAPPPGGGSSPWLLLTVLLLLLLGTIGAKGGSLLDPDQLLYDDPIALNLAVPLTSSSSSSSPDATTTTTATSHRQRHSTRVSTTPSLPRLTTTKRPPRHQDAIEGFEDSQYEFRFTSALYNVSIPENSMGKTYVTPEEKMGIVLGKWKRGFEEIKFRIHSGDKDKFFKAEERVVGDFCFLMLRTKTGNIDVLNRERKDKFKLEIRASAKRHDGKKFEAQTSVVVTVLDTNDLNPLFYPTDYETTVTEDTPMHKSILRVSAEDADLGRNGEIYYSFSEKTEQFAVHPVSGVVTLTRPLR